MSDMGDDFRALREWRQDLRRRFAVPCQDCRRLLPRAHPSLLLPGQKCRMHAFRAPRSEAYDRETGGGPEESFDQGVTR